MRYKPILFIVAVLLAAGSAFAADFGGHVGYFGNDIRNAYLGVDAMFPVGPIALVPNFDYAKAHGLGYWWANGDVAFRFAPGGGATFWVGAGPAYEFLTGHPSGTTTGYMHLAPNQYGGGGSGGGSGGSGGGSGGSGGGSSPSGGTSSAFTFDNGARNAWGYDVTAGVALPGHLRPYIQGHYEKVRNFKTVGAAVGFRFGRF